MKKKRELERIRKHVTLYLSSRTGYQTTDNSCIINSNGAVDIMGNYILNLPDHIQNIPFKINSIIGKLHLYGRGLTSLHGLPQILDGDLVINPDVNIKTLKGCPKIIKGSFECLTGTLTTFKNAPKLVGGGVLISGALGIEINHFEKIDDYFLVAITKVKIVKMPVVLGITASRDSNFEMNLRTYTINEIINYKTCEI